MYKLLSATLLLSVLGLCPPIPKNQSKPVGSLTPTEEYNAIMRDIKEALRSFTQPRSPEKERAARGGNDQKRELDFGGSLLTLAKKYPNDPVAVDSLTYMVHPLWCKESPEAIAILTRDHAGSKQLGPVCGRLAGYWPGKGETEREQFLRSVLARNQNIEVLAQARFALARMLKFKSELIQSLKVGGESAAEVREQFDLTADQIKRLKETDPDGLGLEATKLFTLVIEKHSDDKATRDPRTLGVLAKADLFKLQGHLEVGQMAPEIDGVDANGNRFKLSDYRGKVVVVSFWGLWCPACMAQVPHERDLVKRLNGKPFAFLGVNSDSEDNKDGFRRAVNDGKITWRNWWDGGSSEGPIATKYNVRGWPETYIINHKGEIRYKGLRGDQLDKAVDALLKDPDLVK